MKDSKSEIIDSIAAKGDGLTVPDNYFADFAAQMAEKLPFREELDLPAGRQVSPRQSRWLRVRPYVYMAAMFAGAWCLIKMFSLMSPSTADVSIDNYPGLSLALEDEQFVDEYILDGVSVYDIMEDTYYDTDDRDDEYPEDDIAAQADNPDEHSYILPTDNMEPSQSANQ